MYEVRSVLVSARLSLYRGVLQFGCKNFIMVEAIDKIADECNKIQNIPVIFIEDRDDEVNERMINGLDHYSPSVRVVNITKCLDISGFGFLLSRSKWDPYPYISKIDDDSPASTSGLREGDCVLEVSDCFYLNLNTGKN